MTPQPRFTSMPPPQVRNYLVEWVADHLGIHRDQFRGMHTTADGQSVYIVGCYRQDGIYYEFQFDVNRAKVIRNEVC